MSLASTPGRRSPSDLWDWRRWLRRLPNELVSVGEVLITAEDLQRKVADLGPKSAAITLARTWSWSGVLRRGGLHRRPAPAPLRALR